MGDVSSQAAYLQDCYNREFEAVVEEAIGKYIVLEKTFFYPDSGGQPYDTGMLMTEDGRMFKVIFVGKEICPYAYAHRNPHSLCRNQQNFRRPDYRKPDRRGKNKDRLQP